MAPSVCSSPSSVLATSALLAFVLGASAQFGGSSVPASSVPFTASNELDSSATADATKEVFKPLCPLVACAQAKAKVGCSFISDGLVDKNGCPVNPCGIEICPSPFPCPIVLCAAPKPGCILVFDDLVDENGCPVNPCGIEVCPSPPVPFPGVFLGIKNGPGSDVIFTVATDVDIAGLQFEIELNGKPVSTAFAFILDLPNNFAALGGSATLALAVDSAPLSSTGGELIDAVQVGFVDAAVGDEVCLLDSSVVSGPFGVAVSYQLVQPPCVIIGGTPPPPPPPPKKCPKPEPCPFKSFKPIGCLFKAELASESLGKLTQVLSTSNEQFAQFSASALESESASLQFQASASLSDNAIPSASSNAQFAQLPPNDDVVIAAGPEDLLQAEELFDKFLCPISFCEFKCPPPPPPPPPPTKCPGKTKGDLDNDGFIEVVDLVALLDVILTVTPSEVLSAPLCKFYAEDLNEDQLVSIQDTVAIVDKIVG